MTVDPHVVKIRLDKILTHVSYLSALSSFSEDEFLKDDIMRRATERSLQIIAQGIIDVCTHLVAHNHWGAPKSYSESVKLVASHGIIGSELAERLVDLVKLRNIIIHLYLEVDSTIIFKSALQAISDAKDFVRSITRMLDE